MDLTALMNRIVTRAMKPIRGLVVMPGATDMDLSSMLAANKGDVLNIPITQTMGIIDITPGITAQAGDLANITPKTTPVTMDKWRGTKILTMTDFELSKIMATDDFIPSQLTQGAVELAEDVNAQVMDKMRSLTYNYIGTLGTPPFTGSGTESGTQPMTKAMNAMDKAKAPTQNRMFVMDLDTKMNAMNVSQFTSAQEIGNAQNRITGQFANDMYGFKPLADGQVPTHTNGTATGVTTATLNALGSSTVVLKVASGTLTLTVGTIFTFANHTQTYVVTGTSTYSLGTGGTAVTISPPLAAVVDGTSVAVAVTIVGAASASYKTDFFYEKSAVKLVTRPITANDPVLLGLGLPTARKSVTMRDPVTGLIFRLQLFDMYNQYGWQLDCLSGVAVPRPEHVFKYIYTV